MINTQEYMHTLKDIDEIAKRYNISDSIFSKIDICKMDIKTFSLKVLFVGKFNAGKSALVNSVLNRDLLVEKQAPETAIATEIVFDKNEYVELFNINGELETCALDEISQYNPINYTHFRYHLNNEYIEKHPNHTIVDMPGFNSTIERHNKAIMQYAGQGNAYTLVVDCEEGEIKSTALDFIREIKQYDNSLAVVVSKSDKKPESQIIDIMQKIENTAKDTFNKDLTVVSTSKFDDDIKEKMEMILNSFDSQDLFEQKFKPAINEIANLCRVALESIVRSYDFDDSEIEREINSRKKSKKKLLKQLVKECKRLSEMMDNNVKQSIMDDVRSALSVNSVLLASSLENGGEAFTRAVNNILRPVLISSTQKYTEESFSEFVENIDLTPVFSENNSKELALKITDSYNITTSKINQLASKGSKVNGTYKTIMSALAITTSVVAPWIELVVLFLPEIFKLFGALDKSSQLSSIKLKVENEIIPQIVSKMEGEIGASLKDLEAEMIQDIEIKINELIDVETEALNRALEMKATKRVEYEEFKNNIDDDLKKVQILVNGI